MYLVNQNHKKKTHTHSIHTHTLQVEHPSIHQQFTCESAASKFGESASNSEGGSRWDTSGAGDGVLWGSSENLRYHRRDHQNDKGDRDGEASSILEGLTAKGSK